MDPLSISTAVGAACTAAYTTSNALYSFVTSAKKVDESLESLHLEIQGLNRALDAIAVILDKIGNLKSDDPTLQSSGIWSSIDLTIKDCRRTFDAFNKLLPSRSSPSSKSSFFRKGMKQMKLNLSKEEITNLRSHIGTHTTSLQLALQMINLYTSCASANASNPQLDVISPKLDALIQMMSRTDPPDSTVDSKPLPPYFENEDLKPHTEELRRSARAVITSASTIITAGTTTRGESEYLFPAGSLLREPLDPVKILQIENWIPGSVSDHQSIRSLTFDTSKTGGKIYDKSGETDLARIQEDLREANLLYQTWAFTNAEIKFSNALYHIRTATPEWREKFQWLIAIDKAKLKLGFCDLELGRLGDAQALFEELEASEEAQQNLVMTHASYGLSQVLLCKGEIIEAKKMCKQAIHGFKELEGPDHADTHKAIKLLAVIYEMDDDLSVSADVMKRLPQDWLQRALAASESPLLGVPDVDRIEHICGRAMHEMQALDTTDMSIIPGRVRALPSSVAPHEVRAEEFRAAVSNCLRESELVAQATSDVDTRGSTEPATFVCELHAESLDLAQVLAHRATVKNGFARPTDDGQVSPISEDLDAALFNLAQHGPPGYTGFDTGTTEPGTWLRRTEICLNQLLDKGAEINAKGPMGWTTLHYASQNNLDFVVEVLLKSGIKVNERNSTGRTALLLATENANESMVRCLIEYGANTKIAERKDGNNAFLVAALQGATPIYEILLDSDSTSDPGRDNDGNTPLHVCAGNGHTGMTKYLLTQGSDISAINHDGWSPLHFASANDQGAMIQQLTDEGARLEQKTNTGLTALNLAALHRNNNTVRCLLDLGAKTSTRCNEGRTPLISALSVEGVESFVDLLKIMNALCGYGADARAEDYDGISVRMWAKGVGDERVEEEVRRFIGMGKA